MLFRSIKNIKYILNYFTNLCTSAEELHKQIIFYNLNETNFSIQQYHQLILQKLIDKMIIINKKVNYTILNDIFDSTGVAVTNSAADGPYLNGCVSPVGKQEAASVGTFKGKGLIFLSKSKSSNENG